MAVTKKHAFKGTCAQLISHVQVFAIPWTATRQAPLSMGFPRQEYWSRLPFPTPGNLPAPGIKPMSPVSLALKGRFFNHPANQEALTGLGNTNLLSYSSIGQKSDVDLMG